MIGKVLIGKLSCLVTGLVAPKMCHCHCAAFRYCEPNFGFIHCKLKEFFFDNQYIDRNDVFVFVLLFVQSDLLKFMHFGKPWKIKV